MAKRYALAWPLTPPPATARYAPASSGDLAYTVGFERSNGSVDGRPPRDMVVRATQIYRRIDGWWKLMHRHADFPPADQRITPVPGLVPHDV